MNPAKKASWFLAAVIGGAFLLAACPPSGGPQPSNTFSCAKCRDDCTAAGIPASQCNCAGCTQP